MEISSVMNVERGSYPEARTSEENPGKQHGQTVAAEADGRGALPAQMARAAEGGVDGKAVAEAAKGGELQREGLPQQRYDAINSAQLDEIHAAVNSTFEISPQSELQISYNEKLGRTFARVVDAESKDVVVEIPPERLIKIYEQLKEMQDQLNQSSRAATEGQKYGQVGMLLETAG